MLPESNEADDSQVTGGTPQATARLRQVGIGMTDGRYHNKHFRVASDIDVPDPDRSDNS